ncbi:carbamate kinase [archaeon]|nr:carbamate kinase [archaeon]|tara:strand:+ start:21113 stop:22045 length:933 start_codon:yes stop_codon:yes gene_type:complete
MKNKTIIIALGGNALIKKGEKHTSRNLVKNISKVCKNIIPIIKDNKTIISHGNGPEIGYLLLQNEASKKLPQMPLDILGAQSQGLIGYPLEEQLLNELRKKNIKRNISTILTQVLVDKKDPAFKEPTKFVGPYYTKQQAKKLSKKGMKIKEDSKKGYRRVVPSPKPIKIIEENTIKKLVNKNNITIAAGGGGIPVIRKNNLLQGIEAVIDKDLASSLLAKSVKASLLLILTDIPKVAINFKQKNQRFLSSVDIKTIKLYKEQGHFPPGSMGPKIDAAIDFLENKGKKVIITNPENAYKALLGKAGTIVTK